MKYVILLTLISIPLCAMEIPMENAAQTVKIPSDKLAAAKKIVSQAGMQEKDNTINALVEAFTLMEKDPQLPVNLEEQSKIGINAVKLAWHSLHTAQKAVHAAKKRAATEQPAGLAESAPVVTPAQATNLIQEATTFIEEVLD